MNNQRATSGTPPYSDSTNGQQTKALWRSIPLKLKQIDNGKVVEQLQYLRDNVKETAPSEIHMLMNPSEVANTAQSEFSKTARKIESVRNIFLFLPLMITWVSFGLASMAFAQSVVGNAGMAGQSFFGLWVNGFPDLSSLAIGKFHLPLIIFAGWHWFSFGDVALTDFILLSFVVFLNQLAHILENHAQKDAMELRAWLREEERVLGQRSLVRAIGTGPESEQPKWAVQVHAAINSLQNVLQGVEIATSQSQKSFAETIARFSDTYQQQNKSVDDLIQNARDIEVAITHLHTVYQSSRDIYIRLESILPRMGEQFDKMAGQQEMSTRALLAIAENIKRASEAITQLAQPFAAVGLAQMAQQRAAQERANLDLLGQMEQRLVQHTQNIQAGKPPRFSWRTLFKSRKQP